MSNEMSLDLEAKVRENEIKRFMELDPEVLLRMFQEEIYYDFRETYFPHDEPMTAKRAVAIQEKKGILAEAIIRKMKGII